MLKEMFFSVAIAGIEPVLWLLIFMSFLGLSVSIERFFVFQNLKKMALKMDYYELKIALEARLGILATMGNNAPFIGLFGTVLGVIQAFHSLGKSGAMDVGSVMIGISEALVATAAGLFVAIPCVIIYNYFVRVTRVLLTQNEAHNRHD
ncbi:MAG: MotA/TolQ/ExbB proton channel family protein [Sulfurospirillum sp.]|nr:MotA/TolQ/ExbB proton channel family protein [Campylobacteraceae bacterium]MBP9566701.1 MotA/TolQ/ExbB proton channel family protein [Sulfurospirillum sp.]